MDIMNVKINENNINKELNKMNSIEGFYANTGILVTEASFVGKSVLQKLCVCPFIATIFVLLRPEKNQTMEERFRKLIDICK